MCICFRHIELESFILYENLIEYSQILLGEVDKVKLDFFVLISFSRPVVVWFTVSIKLILFSVQTKHNHASVKCVTWRSISDLKKVSFSVTPTLTRF